MNSANGGDILFHIKGDTTDLDKKTKDTEKNLKNTFNSIGNAMTIGATIPLTALATAGVKYNAELESYTANLTTLLGGNKKQAEELLNTLKETAKTTPYETSHLVKATQTMMSFGISADNAKKYLNQIGDISMGNAEKLSGLTLAFSQVQSAGKLTGQDLLQMINQGFNPLNIISKETGESMASLKERMSEGGVSAEEVAHAFEVATSKGGLFYKGMEKGAQTTEGKISTLKDSFKEATGSLTESLLPALTSIVEALTKVADWFGNLSESGKKTVLIIGGIVASIGPLIKIGMGVYKIYTAFSKFVAIMKSLQIATKLMTIAQLAFNTVMAMNPIVLIIIAIVALIAIIVLLYNKCEWFRNFVIGMWEGIKAIIKVVINVFKGIINTVVSVVNAIINALRPIINFIVNLVVNYIQFYINIIKTVIKGLATFIKNPIETIGFIVGYVVGKIILLVQNIIAFIQSIPEKVGTLVELIKTKIVGVIAFVQSIPEKVGALVELIKNKIVEFLTAVWNFLMITIPNIINSIIQWFAELPGKLWNILLLVIDKVKQWLTNMYNKVKTGIKEVVNGIIQWFKDLPNKMLNIGKNIVEGIWKGIKNAKDWLMGKVKDFVGGFTKGLKKALGIGSPSKLMADQIGQWIPKGIAVGIEANTDSVYKAMQDMSNIGLDTNFVNQSGLHYSPNVIVNNNVNMKTDPLGQVVGNIKTFSGGAKNDYNYGMGV